MTEWLKNRPKYLVLLSAFLGVLILYWDYFLNSKIFYSADNYPFFYVMQKYFFDALKDSGNLTFWVPYVNLGTSFLYNPATGIYYLPNYVQALLPSQFVMHFFWVLHIGFLVWALYRWAKNSGAALEIQVLVPSLFAGAAITHIFSVTQIAYLYGMTWSACVLSELSGGFKTKWSLPRFLIFWIFLMGNGEVFSVFLTGVAVGVLLLSRRDWKTITVFGVTSLFAALIMYGQSTLILPYTDRAQGLEREMRMAFSFHPYRLLTWFSPYWFGHIIDHTFDPKSAVNTSPFYPRLFFDTVYMSLPLLFFIFMGAIESARKKIWIWLGLAAFGLLTAFGPWGIMQFLSEWPPFKYLRFPEKMMCVTSLLLVALSFELKERFWEKFKFNHWILFFALAIVLPLFSKRNELWISILAAGFTAVILLWTRKKIKFQTLVFSSLLIGWAQNLVALPPQRSIEGADTARLSPPAQILLQSTKPGGFARLEVTADINAGDRPHPYLLFGTNMLHRRSSVIGYTSTDNHLVNLVREKIHGPNTADQRAPVTLTITDAQKMIQLTHWHFFALRMDSPIPHLFTVMDKDAHVFQLHQSTGPWAIVKPENPPSFGWFFPYLEEFKDGDSLISWPPKVSSHRVFKNGLETLSAKTEPQCDKKNVQPLPLGENFIQKKTEDEWLLNIEAPCDGWIFISQNMVPGWRLFDQTGTELPITLANQTLVAFEIKKGQFQGRFVFEPWRALRVKMLGF